MADEYAVLNIDRDVVVASRIKVAGTSKSRKQGLLGIDRVAAGGGLWIAPCEAIHTVGMKIPIDVLFLDRNLRVTKVVPYLNPFRISFCFSAFSVLEVEAGTIHRTNTSAQDRLRFTAL